MPITELQNAPLVKVGIKQTSRAVIDQRAKKVFVAKDTEPHVIRRLLSLAEENQVPLEYIPSMKELGKACNIDVGAATAVIIKE